MALKALKSQWRLLIWGVFLLFESAAAQNSGSIWLKEFLPGSAQITDQSIDQKTLSFIDSLMQRDDLEVTFLGGADPTQWQLFGKRVKSEVADTWDQAKKLERASILRQRYNRGQIGTTDEPVRGVKVVWEPKKPDLFGLAHRLGQAELQIDSLNAALDSLNRNSSNLVTHSSSLLPTENGNNLSYHATTTLASDWGIKTGVMVWTAGGRYDLSVPYIGLALKRQDWAFQFQGGFTPWSEYSADSPRGDALLLGSVQLFPQSWLQFECGLFSGWEFLTKSDVWTMKIMGLTVGPKLRWHFMETYLGYTFGKLSSLTDERWCSGALINTNFHLKLN